ncbi:hypothetical protein Agabi119p4_9764 [Agaricus bisporus var. burnettii]|uniref:Uncharacterized protein n=1 Tax=Agaricus bisporus var. burnettii TaxID=192524 RepID=A0A8H7EXB6_AGABI|nr:hypothetical protein Agabi119p4_9764 [Agaricus bisporus var. burnettii]
METTTATPAIKRDSLVAELNQSSLFSTAKRHQPAQSQRSVDEEHIAATVVQQNNHKLKRRKYELYRTIAADDEICDSWRKATDKPSFDRIASDIRMRLWPSDIPFPSQIISNILSWASNPTIADNLPLRFRSVLAARKQNNTKYKKQKRNIIKRSNLTLNADAKRKLLDSLPIIECKRQSTPFPPEDLYISETDEIYRKNMAFVLERDLPDSRLSRKLIFQLNHPSSWDEDLQHRKLSHDLSPADSGIFMENNEPVAIIIQNACNDNRILDFVDDAIQETIATRNNARKEDRGHISQMGLSAGSRKRHKLGWVRNIRKAKSDTEMHHRVDYDASSAFAVLWSLVRSLLPDDPILNDFQKFIGLLGSDVRMDGNHTMDADSEGRGTYHIQIGDKDFVFRNAELAPPCGVMAENYCRFIHNESQPHKWAVSLTSSRSFDPSLPSIDAGGHFYIASYAIRIQAARNTLIAWRPGDWHGTSLFNINPDTSNIKLQYRQRGLCIVTGKRILGAVKKWRSGLISDADLDKEEEAESSTAETTGDQSIDLWIKDLQSATKTSTTKESHADHGIRASLCLKQKPRKSYTTGVPI